MLTELMNGHIVETGDVLENVTDEDLSQLLAVALEDSYSDEELASIIEESASMQLTPVEERTIVKLDNKAKKRRYNTMAILQCAKEDDSKDYKKLCTLWKMEKFLMQRLTRKYHSRAKARAKVMEKEAKKNKGGLFKKATNGLTRSEIRERNALKGNGKIPSALKTQTNAISNQLKAKIK